MTDDRCPLDPEPHDPWTWIRHALVLGVATGIATHATAVGVAVLLLVAAWRWREAIALRRSHPREALALDVVVLLAASRLPAPEGYVWHLTAGVAIAAASSLAWVWQLSPRLIDWVGAPAADDRPEDALRRLAWAEPFLFGATAPIARITFLRDAGRDDEARRVAAALADGGATSLDRAFGALALARLDIVDGALASARAHLDAFVAECGDTPHGCLARAELLLARGDLHAAADAAHAAERIARSATWDADGVVHAARLLRVEALRALDPASADQVPPIDRDALTTWWRRRYDAVMGPPDAVGDRGSTDRR